MVVMVNRLHGTQFDPVRLPPGRVAVMFYADWCGYSRRFSPDFERLREGWVVDISDEEDPLWDALAIEVVPTVILFEDGRPVRRWAGVLGQGHAEEVLQAVGGDG